MLMYLNSADIDIHYQIERFEIMYPSYICIKSGEHGFAAGKKLLAEYHGSSVTRTRDRSKKGIF
jgi:hypothetical protein